MYMRILKPAMHYSRTWRIGDEIIFSPNKILLVKTRRMCCCTLFVVRRQFSCSKLFFFYEKILCVRRRDRYPDANPAYSVRRKTCSRNMANSFYTLFAVCRFFVVSPLFRCCSRIVYSGHNNLIATMLPPTFLVLHHWCNNLTMFLTGLECISLHTIRHVFSNYFLIGI